MSVIGFILELGIATDKMPQASLPKSFHKVPIDGGELNQIHMEPPTGVVDTPYITSQGSLPKRDQAQPCFVNEI